MYSKFGILCCKTIFMVCINHENKTKRYMVYNRYCKSFNEGAIKNNYNPQRHLVWRAKNYFRSLGVPSN